MIRLFYYGFGFAVVMAIAIGLSPELTHADFHAMSGFANASVAEHLHFDKIMGYR